MFNEPDQGQEGKPNIPATLEATLAEIVGVDKKYKTLEDAVKSISPAQEHIEKLEDELAALREDVTKSKTQEELLEEMRIELAKTQTPPQAEPEPAAADPVVEPKDDNLSGDDIQAMISAQLQLAASATSEATNIKNVTSAAIKVWGSDAQNKFYEAAKNNGYDEATIKALAATSPQAALHAVGLASNAKVSPMATSPAGTLRTNSPEFSNVKEPEIPTNWGNDNEVATYMAELQKYEDSKEK